MPTKETPRKTRNRNKFHNFINNRRSDTCWICADFMSGKINSIEEFDNAISNMNTALSKILSEAA